MASFSERTKVSLQKTLLDAALDLLLNKGYAALRMADVAARAGVSRQTVYNEFGNKAALVQSAVLRSVAEFRHSIRQRFDSADHLISGIRCTVAFTIDHGRENRLIAAVFGTEAGEDLLPLLATRGEPILSAAIELAAEHYRKLEPGLSRESAALLAETVVRLSLSHLVLRTHSAAEAADSVCAVLAPALAHCLAQQNPAQQNPAQHGAQQHSFSQHSSSTME